MAFNGDDLSLAVDTIGGSSIRVFFYIGEDTYDEVMTSGYFVRGAKHGLRMNDTVMFTDQNAEVYVARVSEIDESGNVTVVDVGSPRTFGTPQELLNSDAPSLGRIGSYVYAGGHKYQIVENGHLVTAGGVNLGVQPGENGYNVVAFGALGDYVIGSGGTDDTEAIQLALNTGAKVWVPKSLYLITRELELVTPGQVVEFETNGGYAYGEDIGQGWKHGTQFVIDSTFSPRIRTRRLFRGSPIDPEDDPLSVAINIQAEAVILDKVSLWLECDYSDASPSNLGADCDVGIFIGTRVGVQLHDIQVIGYFRSAGVYLDVTGLNPAPRFPDLNGNPYPSSGVNHGCDGFRMTNPYIRGPRRGFAVLGALPKVGETDYTDDYYDQLSASYYTDARGSFGCSDLMVEQGRIYGPDHHSNRRLMDPDGGSGLALNETSLNNEPDDAPCCMQIDGLAGNGSNNIWGMRFFGTRFATFEAFRVRLGRASRIFFYSSHIEGRGSGRFNTAGVSIDQNDYVNTSYGDISSISVTDRIGVIGTFRTNPESGVTPHFYSSDGPATVLTDRGALYLAASAHLNGILEDVSGELDLRAADGDMVRIRSGSVTMLTVEPKRVYSRDSEFVSRLSLEVGDDAAVPITPPSDGGRLVLTCTGDGGNFPRNAFSGTVWYDVGTSPSQRLVEGGTDFNSQLGDLTGTTGVDGKVTIGVIEGAIKIENRTGATVEFKYRWDC